jgi:Cu/Ag efflux protein CusF
MRVRWNLSRIRQIALAAFLLFALFACQREPDSAPSRQYSLTGKVLALNAKDRTATVDAAAIPGFMEAMTMEYPIKSKTDFEKLHVGDKITATVNVRDGGLYDLSNVQRQGSRAPK